MSELSFLTIIVSLAVCSILVFAVYQYMKVRFTVLEQSQKEQALILQQYIEESAYDIQGLQSIVFRQPQHQAQPGAGSEPVEIFEDHNKHIHMDTVMYEAPNKQRSALIAISSDSENTTSDESSDSEEGSGSEGSGSEGSGSDSEGSESSDSDSDDIECEIECDNVIHDIHEVKHIEISLPTDNNNNNNNINELDIESVTIIDESSPEEPVAELPTETTEIKTITVDLGTSPDTSSMSTDTIDVLSLLNKNAMSNEEHDVDTDLHFTVPSAAAAAAGASASASFQGLSVIELRALLKEKYKGQPEKITNLQKLKKPELIQLLHE
jgi:hypothetical protein